MPSSVNVQESPKKEFRMPLDVIEAQFKFLKGEILTIADAITSGQQNKATKDLINAAFNNRVRFIQRMDQSTDSEHSEL